jgi:hypothetical protein
MANRSAEERQALSRKGAKARWDKQAAAEALQAKSSEGVAEERVPGPHVEFQGGE